MKTILYFAIILFSASLYSAEPVLKLYHIDGSTKEYKLSEIDSLSLIDQKNNYVLRIHYEDSLVAYYPTEIIGSIKFEKDSLNVYIFSYPKPYKLSSIDSLIFYIDQWQPLTIGSQVWMLKNLNVDHYRNGDSIPEVRDSIEWTKLKTGAWCNNFNSDSLGKIYGKLYNWYAVNDVRGLAPTGWHIPADAEWKELEMCFGMTQTESDQDGFRGTNEGGILKSTGIKQAGTGLWYSPNTGATNESGFSAQPGGVRYYAGTFNNIGNNGYWWTATESGSTDAWRRGLHYLYSRIARRTNSKENGFSVRCVKDK